MLRMRLYSERSREALVAAGRAARVELRRGLRTVAATDGPDLDAGRLAAPARSRGSTKPSFPPTTTGRRTPPDNLDWSSIEGAIDALRAIRACLT